MDKFFATMDRDFDGRLTLEEFMGEETPIEKLFKLMDKNGDGFVTKKVVYVWLHLIQTFKFFTSTYWMIVIVFVNICSCIYFFVCACLYVCGLF